MRDDFPPRTKVTLAQRVGMCCSNPNCRQLTSGPQKNRNKAISIGVAAHISAASPGGPRYNPELSAHERRSIDNGIWLCQNCAKLVDNDEVRFTADLLHDWKRRAEEVTRAQVQSPLRSRPRKEIAASGAEGYELIDAIEHFITETIDIEHSLEPIWAIPADAPDRVCQIEGLMTDQPWFRLAFAAERVYEGLYQARRWFLQLGFDVDETEQKIECIKLAVGLAAARVWITGVMADSQTPGASVRNIVDNGKELLNTTARMAMEGLGRILEHLRYLLASHKWLLPRPKIVRPKSGQSQKDVSETEIAAVLDTFATATMEMKAHGVPLVNGQFLDIFLDLQAAQPVEQQRRLRLIEAFCRCRFLLWRAHKLFWRLCGPEWSTLFYEGVCSIVSRAYHCALHGENDDYWAWDMKMIYIVSQWLHREADGSYGNDRVRSGSDLWSWIAEAMGSDMESHNPNP